MPNPYKGNAAAAKYLARLGTKEDIEERTKRLYDKSIESRMAAVKAVELEMYPQDDKKGKRTAAEQKAYIEKMLKEAEKRHMEERIQIEKQMYAPHWRNCLSPQKEKEIVDRMYVKPLRRFEKVKEALKARSTNVPEAKDAELVRRERQWKPVLRSPDRRDRHLHEERPHIDREVDAIKAMNTARRPHSAAGRKAAAGEGERPGSASPSRKSRAEIAEYWARMAKPFVVHPKVPVPKPGFTVYTKYGKASDAGTPRPAAHP